MIGSTNTFLVLLLYSIALLTLDAFIHSYKSVRRSQQQHPKAFDDISSEQQEQQVTHDDTNSSSSSSSQVLSYKSLSTSSPEATCEFYSGSNERKEKLHDALREIGTDPQELLGKYQACTAAIRTYTSFIYPKSEGALAMAEKPQRAAVVANNIAFLLREYRSHQETWLRNHDRALDEIDTSARNPMIVVLDNIRSAPNVGNILRAAEAAKCDCVYLCGSMTPTPPHPKLLKTAMGAAEYLRYKKVGSTLQAIQTLKAQGVKVIGVETTSRSIPLWNLSFFDQKEDDTETRNNKVAFVFGNEMVGIDTICLEECDELISLPTHGVKNSLNVATCASVVLWEALRQLDS